MCLAVFAQDTLSPGHCPLRPRRCLRHTRWPPFPRSLPCRISGMSSWRKLFMKRYPAGGAGRVRFMHESVSAGAVIKAFMSSTMKNDQGNNFDFLRLLAASLVFISHQSVLAGRGEVELTLVGSSGKLGVYIFFSISGYLTAESWRRDPNIFRFAIKRFLRIWPGLAAVTIFAALAIGPMVSSMDAQAYYMDPGFLRYFKILWLEIVYDLPGVFEKNPYPISVNGSLWTIPIEVFWYVFLVIIGSLGMTRFGGLFVVLHIAVIALAFNLHILTKGIFSYIDFGLYFCYGVCLSAGRMHWMPHKKLVLALVSSLAITYHAIGLTGLAVWIFLPYAVVLFGSSSTPCLRSFGKYGDISYGLYLYAFPIQQAMVFAIGAAASYALLFSMSYAVTLLFAYMSWHMLEYPAIRLKPYRRQGYA
ncbi:acyltransferase [Verminephrobacter eiseniae]|nr:acyltransferase [Verminephrobacter eiseniae]